MLRRGHREIIILSLLLILAILSIVFTPILFAPAENRAFLILILSSALSPLLIILSYILYDLLTHFPIEVVVDFGRRVVVAKGLRGKAIEISYKSIKCVETKKFFQLWKTMMYGGIRFRGIHTFAGEFIDIEEKLCTVYTDTEYSLVIDSVDGKRYVFWVPENLKSVLCGEEL